MQGSDAGTKLASMRKNQEACASVTGVCSSSLIGAPSGMELLRLQLTPFFQRNQLCLGGGVVFCCQQLSSSQRWDSSSECSRKSRPHFPPGAAAQRDPICLMCKEAQAGNSGHLQAPKEIHRSTPGVLIFFPLKLCDCCRGPSSLPLPRALHTAPFLLKSFQWHCITFRESPNILVSDT